MTRIHGVVQALDVFERRQGTAKQVAHHMGVCEATATKALRNAIQRGWCWRTRVGVTCTYVYGLSLRGRVQATHLWEEADRALQAQRGAA